MRTDHIVYFVVAAVFYVREYRRTVVVLTAVDKHCFAVGQLDKYRIALPHVEKVDIHIGCEIRRVFREDIGDIA